MISSLLVICAFLSRSQDFNVKCITNIDQPNPVQISLKLPQDFSILSGVSEAPQKQFYFVGKRSGQSLLIILKDGVLEEVKLPPKYEIFSEPFKIAGRLALLGVDVKGHSAAEILVNDKDLTFAIGKTKSDIFDLFNDESIMSVGLNASILNRTFFSYSWLLDKSKERVFTSIPFVGLKETLFADLNSKTTWLAGARLRFIPAVVDTEKSDLVITYPQDSGPDDPQIIFGRNISGSLYVTAKRANGEFDVLRATAKDKKIDAAWIARSTIYLPQMAHYSE